jgi:hypothetical protein
MNHKKLYVMDNILVGLGNLGDFDAPVKEVDCLIYKNSSKIKDEILENHGEKL